MSDCPSAKPHSSTLRLDLIVDARALGQSAFDSCSKWTMFDGTNSLVLHPRHLRRLITYLCRRGDEDVAVEMTSRESRPE